MVFRFRPGDIFDEWLRQIIYCKEPGADGSMHRFVYGQIFHGDAAPTEIAELADVFTGVVLVAISSRIPVHATLLGLKFPNHGTRVVRARGTETLSVAQWVPDTNVNGFAAGFDLTDLVESGNHLIAQGLLECIEHYGRAHSSANTSGRRRYEICHEQVRRACQVMDTPHQKDQNILVRSYYPVMSWCKYLDVQPNGPVHHPFIKALCEPTRLVEISSSWLDHAEQTRSVSEMLRIFCQETVNVGVRSMRQGSTCPRMGLLINTDKKSGERRPVSSTIVFLCRSSQLDATQGLPSGPLKNRGILVCRRSAVEATRGSCLHVGKVCVILSEGSHIESQECKITPAVTTLMDAQGREREVDDTTEVITFLLADVHMEHFTHEAFRRVA